MRGRDIEPPCPIPGLPPTWCAYFDRALGTYFAEVADNGLSFLGVLFDSREVASARIVTGNAALGPNDGNGVDVVAMDDFIYAEPTVAPVPGPAAWAMMIVGFGLTGSMMRRRRPVTVTA